MSKSCLVELVGGCISSLRQCTYTDSSRMGHPCLLYSVISLAQGNPCVHLRTQPHAAESTPTTLTCFISTKILSIVEIDTLPWSSLNSIGLKLCCTTILHFSNDAWMAVCCSLSKLWMFSHEDSKFPWLNLRCRFNFTCALSTLVTCTQIVMYQSMSFKLKYDYQTKRLHVRCSGLKIHKLVCPGYYKSVPIFVEPSTFHVMECIRICDKLFLQQCQVLKVIFFYVWLN